MLILEVPVLSAIGLVINFYHIMYVKHAACISRVCLRERFVVRDVLHLLPLILCIRSPPARQNPNYLSATLNGIVMTMYHEDLAGREAPFGIVTFAGENAARLPARGSAVVQAQVGKVEAISCDDA